MTRMNGILGVVVSAVVVLLIVLVGWFGLVSPQRSKADKLGGEVSSAKSTLSADQTLAWEWAVTRAGERTFRVYLWNGKRYAEVIHAIDPAPKPK